MFANKAFRFVTTIGLIFAVMVPNIARANNAADPSPIPLSPRQNIASVMAGAVQISSGDMDTCAITFAGGLKCWGANGYGQLGDGTTITR